MTRTEIINKEIETLKPKSYLEIGFGNGENFEGINCENKEVVDPIAPYNSPGGKVHRMISDAFFDKYNGHVDLIFIDGDHSYKQSKKDLEAALKHINKGGMVVMHDTCPKDEEYATMTWCGEVYKTIADIANSRKHLNWKTVNDDHGVTFFWKIDKANKPLDIPIGDWADWNKNKKKIMKFV